MAMIGAPRALASSTNGHMCGFDVSVLVPQSSTRSLSGIPSGSAPTFAPTVICMPILPGVEQIVRSSFDAPMEWKNRRSIDDPCTMPIVPAYEYGRIACGPSLEFRISFRRVAISSSASSHEIRANFPEPFGPARRIGWSSRSSWYVRSTYRLTFAQRKPRVNGCSGSPATRTARPDSTVTSIAHVSGQSCGHAPRTMRDAASGSCDAGATVGVMCGKLGELGNPNQPRWVEVTVRRCKELVGLGRLAPRLSAP